MELQSYWWKDNCVNKTRVNTGPKIEMRGCSGKWAYIHGKDCGTKKLIVAQMNDKHFTALFLAVAKGWVNNGSKAILAVN